MMERETNREEDKEHPKMSERRKHPENYGEGSELGRQKHPETSECESETSGTDPTGNESRRRRAKPEKSEDGRQKHPEIIGYEEYEASREEGGQVPKCPGLKMETIGNSRL